MTKRMPKKDQEAGGNGKESNESLVPPPGNEKMATESTDRKIKGSRHKKEVRAFGRYIVFSLVIALASNFFSGLACCGVRL